VLLTAAQAAAQRATPRQAARASAPVGAIPMAPTVDPPSGTEMDPTAAPIASGLDLQSQLQAAVSPQRTTSTV
jgi:hypothetical protein